MGQSRQRTPTARIATASIADPYMTEQIVTEYKS